MADIIVDRKTYILISDTIQGTIVGLYPRDDLYPSNENNPIYPTNVISVESNIVEGSMVLDEVIADGDIDLGKLYSTKFECDLFNVTTDIQGKFIKVYQTSDEYEGHIPLFLGYIDSCTSDRLGTDYHLIAYDLAYYYGGINISSIWNRYMSTNTPISTTYGDFPDVQIGSGATPSYIKIDWYKFLKLVFDEIGIVYDFEFNLKLDVSGYYGLGIDPMRVVQLYVNSNVKKMLLSDLIASICQLASVIPHWGNDGVFRVIELDTSSTALQEDAIDLTDNYEKSSLNVSQLIVPPFNNISYKYNTYSGKNTTVATFTETVNSNENKYEISNNILLLLTGCIKGSTTYRVPSGHSSGSFNNTYLIRNMCSYLQSLDYYVGSVSLIISDVNDLIGQLVKITINEDETIYFPVLKSSYSGSLLINQTVSADGTIPTVKDTAPVDYSGESSNTQVNELTTTVTDLQSKVNAISTSMDYVTDGSIATNTNTSILSKNITAGTYMITGFISFPNTPNSDTGIRQLRIAYTTDLSTAISYDANDIKSAISGYRTLLKCTTIKTFSTDTTIALVGNHTAGATLSDVIGQLNLLRIS